MKNYVMYGLSFFLLLLGALFFRFVPDYLWFSSLDKQSVWHLRLISQFVFFIVGALIALIWLGVNVGISRYLLKKYPAPSSHMSFGASFGLDQILGALFRYSKDTFNAALSRLIDYIVIGFVAFLSLVFGLLFMSKWYELLLATHNQPMNLLDPIFGHDVSFYLLQMPAVNFLHSWVLGLVAVSLLLVVFIYFMKRTLFMLFGHSQPLTGLRLHLGSLAILLCAIMAYGTWIGRFDILYAKSGVLHGAGYTAHHVQLPLIYILFGLWILQAVFFGVWIRKNTLKPAFFGFLALIFLGVLAGPILTQTVQAYSVAPNELSLEKPYLEHTISFTRKAYSLDAIKTEFYPVKASISYDQLKQNEAVLSNIRLWDEDPLRKTFSQVQEIRQYYEFKKIDVGRYKVNGQLRQVLLSPREMEIDQLSDQAQTWINRHLVYTHGYGLCMSPVNEVSSEGLPSFYIKDIPPVVDSNFVLKRPELYFSEQENHYALVNTKQPEFDYPKGDTNVYTRYQGKGGVLLDSWWKRLVYAIQFSDVKLLISDAVTDKTRILYDRNILQMVQKIAPFLVFDRDPYLVLTPEGRMVWVLDAYTMSSQFPYSEPFARKMNYIRHAAKVAIDAYDGEMKFYVIDESDPIISGYQHVFKELFLPQSQMPTFLKEHSRYPKDYFMIQSMMFCTYHMTDPQVFYNREDVWAFPEKSQPYYMVTQLPGAPRPQFVLATPFTPAKKHNMVAWMSVLCDAEGYGQMTAYKFPKEKTVYGPVQLESRIDQDTEISKDLTLWGQMGTSVIRGDLLVIPIENSLVYVEPLYLQSNQSQLPELKRVVFSCNDQVVMADTLSRAIAGCFSGAMVETQAQDEPKQSGLVGEGALKAIRSRYLKLREIINNELNLIDKELNR